MTGKKGTPAGHAPIVRELVVPVIRAGTVLALMGVGNKTTDYTSDDIAPAEAMAYLAADIALHTKAKEEFERFFGLVPDLVCMVAADGSFRRVNERWETTLGYAPSEMLSHPFIEFVHPEDVEMTRAVFASEVAGSPVTGFVNRYLAKDGSYHWLEWSASPMESEGLIFAVARDITESRQAEAALQLSETRYSDLFENLAEGFAYCQMLYEDGEPVDWIYLDVNPAFEEQTGIVGAAGRRVSEVIPGIRESDPELFETYSRVALTGEPEKFEMHVEALDLWFDVHVHSPETGYFVSLFDVVTERKKTQAEAIERESRLQALLDGAPYGAHMYELMPDGRLVFIGYNARAVEMLGVEHDQFIGHTLEEAFPGNVGTETPDAYRRVAREGGTWSADQYSYDADGVAGVFEVFAFSFGPDRVSVFFRDVTDLRRTENELRDSSERFVELAEQARIFAWEVDAEGLYTYVSPVIESVLGYRPDEVTDRLHFYDLHPEEGREEFAAAAFAAFAEKQPFVNLLNPAETPDGRRVWLSTNGVAVLDADGDLRGYRGSDTDVTERTRFELDLQTSESRLRETVDELAQSARTLTALSACNEALVRAENEQELLQAVCDIAVEQGGYLMTWVGYAEQDEAKTVRSAAFAGAEDGFLTEARFTFDDSPLGQGPPGTAIRTGRSVVFDSIEDDPRYAPWAGLALAHGYSSVAAFPLIVSDGRAIGAVMFITGQRTTFEVRELALLSELASDLAFGIDSLRGRKTRAEVTEQLAESNKSLQALLRQITVALGRVVETRDPYTSGHEERVATLARQIAIELGLSVEDADAIEVAGLVHDIGKLSVPAEILTKPSALSTIEYRLIREHSRSGYDILKDIAFKWPIADIVLQHHERMDGSGYPGGLRGDAISVAARILMAADVIDAMGAHRPYRPALGIEAAMTEITSHPEQYDQQVVAACERLVETGRIKV
jgi:PAS domain S-box-containing protein/putative nucleotidyltransferase with HDIG domain